MQYNMYIKKKIKQHMLQNCCSWVIKTCKNNITWKEVGKLTIFGKNWERSGN